MRVLHVSEALGGGIVSSILAMVDSTPEIDHHLIARSRNEHDTGEDWRGRFSTVTTLPDNRIHAVLSLRRLARTLFPDVVHAHSSHAGALVRVAGLDRPRVVYSPHCFAFERRDIGGPERRLYAGVERLLVPRTDLLAAVAPHEIDLAARLGHREIAYTVNRTLFSAKEPARFEDPPRVVTVGRVSPQKDWRYLLHVKRFAETQLGLRASWEWLGGGDRDGERSLADAGVAVTGWIPRADLLARMSRAQVYLHTAAWEATPMSILEAAELGLPLAVRSIAPLRSLRLPGLADSVADLAERLVLLRDPVQWRTAQAESHAVTRRHNRTIQGRQLREAYARACGRPRAAVDTDPRALATMRTVADETLRPDPDLHDLLIDAERV